MFPQTVVTVESSDAQDDLFAVIDSATEPEPFLYQVAGKISRLLSLSREEQLSTWRRVLDLYSDFGHELHRFLLHLQHEPFVEEILENELFWGVAGEGVSREYYGRASQYLPALFATAALLAAQQDGLPLTSAELDLINGSSPPRMTTE